MLQWTLVATTACAEGQAEAVESKREPPGEAFPPRGMVARLLKQASGMHLVACARHADSKLNRYC